MIRRREVLLCTLLSLAGLNAAGPTVNVALQASFSAPPYLLELL